jgi:hypothetical protein
MMSCSISNMAVCLLITRWKKKSNKFFQINCFRELIQVGFEMKSDAMKIFHPFKNQCSVFIYRDTDKSLAKPTSRCILFNGENISFDVSHVMYIKSNNIPQILIINRIYEHQNLLSLQLVSFLVGLRTYQHPCKCQKSRTECLRQKHALIRQKACKEKLNNQQTTQTQQTLEELAAAHSDNDIQPFMQLDHSLTYSQGFVTKYKINQII